jgi:uncharacterized protein YegJ (DUF2314 family)
MAAAKRKARETLPEFLALARAPRPDTSEFAVKVGIRGKDIVEFFWISPFVQTGKGYSGKINNDPQDVENVKLGDTIKFSEEEIVDWVYLDGKRMRGNFTLCVLFKRSPRPRAMDAANKLGLDCDF